MKSSRIIEYDVLRAFAFLFVVAQHIFGGFAWRETVDTYQSLVLSLLNIIAFPAVPIFMALNAITLLLTNPSSKTLNLWQFYKKKLTYILIPYILVSLFLLYDKGDDRAFDHLLGILITGSADYHLWYMGALLRILLFFPLILWLTNWVYSRSMTTRNLIYLGFVVLYWLLLRNNSWVTESIAHFLFRQPSDMQMKFVTISPLLWSIYFVLGIKMVKEKEQFFHFLNKGRNWILGTYPFLLAYNYYDKVKEPLGLKESDWIVIVLDYCHHVLYITFMLFTILVFYILSRWIVEKRPKILDLLLHISAYSYPAYLIHTWVLAQAAQPIISRGLPYSLPLDLVIYGITVIFSVEISHLISFLPYSQFLTGLKKKSSRVI